MKKLAISLVISAVAVGIYTWAACDAYAPCINGFVSCESNSVYSSCHAGVGYVKCDSVFSFCGSSNRPKDDGPIVKPH